MPGKVTMNWSSIRSFGIAASLFALGAAPAFADGTMTHLSGLVSLQKADGTIAVGVTGAKVVMGDTAVTGAGAYVRIEMTDGGEIVLRPNSQLKIEGYAYSEAKPAEDSFIFSMLKGGMRTVTGLIGKRGNRDAYNLKTETATVGIRGTQFDLRVCQANCGALPDGTYVAVRFGAVLTSNAAGSLGVAAGQVAFVPQVAAPRILPRDPGIGFSPPAVIPKVDEKKKQQAAPATGGTREGQSPATGTTTGTGTAPSTGAKPAAGAPATGEAQDDKPKTEAPAQGQGQGQSGAASAAPQSSDSSGPECSVE